MLRRNKILTVTATAASKTAGPARASVPALALVLTPILVTTS
jgi:hypothetical protein